MKYNFSLTEFNKNILTLITGTTIAQLIPIFFFPILTRLYSPEEFGVYSAYLSLVSVFGLIASLKYELAIPIANNTEEKESLIKLSLIIIGIIGIILFAVLSLMNSKLEQYFKIKSSSYFLIIIIVGFFSQGILNFCRINDKSFKKIGISKIIKNSVLLLGQLGAYFLLFFRPFGLLIGDSMGRWTSLIVLYEKKDNFFKPIKIKHIFLTMKKYKKFPIFSSSATLLIL